jgi:hemolysin type calcium-binding protein
VHVRLLLLALAAAAVLAFPASAPAQMTIPGCLPFSEWINGTPGPDVWQGTDATEGYFADAGDDRIDGLGGDDCLLGHSGADTILGGPGKEYIDGGGGADTVEGGLDDDRVHGYVGTDSVDGGPGNDDVSGGAGRDRVAGGEGDDKADVADLESDTVDCGPGADSVLMDPLDSQVACESVRRLGYNDALLDVRWRARKGGIQFTRARLTRLSGRNVVNVSVDDGGPRKVHAGSRRTVRLGPMEHIFSRGTKLEVFVAPRSDRFWKTFVIRIRHFGNFRNVKSPFRSSAYCRAPGLTLRLSSKRCDRVFGRR